MQEQKDGPLNDLEKRKKVLQDELKKLENELENSLSSIQNEVTDRTSPIWWIRKYPLKVVGLAVLAGFLAGSRDKSGSVAGTTIMAAVAAALKTIAARKIVEQVVKLVEGNDNNSDHS